MATTTDSGITVTVDFIDLPIDSIEKSVNPKLHAAVKKSIQALPDAEFKEALTSAAQTSVQSQVTAVVDAALAKAKHPHAARRTIISSWSPDGQEMRAEVSISQTLREMIQAEMEQDAGKAAS